MRPLKQFAVFAGLCVGMLSSAALGAGAIVSVALGAGAIVSATASPAAAATASPPGNAKGAASPSTATPGSQVSFAVSCASSGASSATFFGTTLGLPARIPMGQGAVSGDFTITVTLPSSIQPGTYTPAMDCSDGSSTTAHLTVTSVAPKGSAQTGDGTTSTQASGGLSAIGLGLIGVGALAGGFALRRRGPTGRR